MAETLLIGVDGSEGSTRAVQFAAARARLSGARLVVAYVIEWSPYSFMTPEELEERHKRHDEEIAKAQTQVVDPIVASLKDQGLSPTRRASVRPRSRTRRCVPTSRSPRGWWRCTSRLSTPS